MTTQELFTQLHKIRIRNKIDYEEICEKLEITMKFAQEIDAGFANLTLEEFFTYTNAIGAKFMIDGKDI